MPSVEVDLERNTAKLGGEPLVFHCHHYNCALQKAVEELHFEGAPKLLQDAALATVREQIATLAPADALSAASEIYRQLGFGKLTISCADHGGEADVEISHYALGWLVKYGARTSPVDHFTCGFLRAAVAVALDVDVDAVKVSQTACMTMGDASNRFAIEVIR